MGTSDTGSRWSAGALLGAMLLCLGFFASSAPATPPAHLPEPSREVGGLNHACGVALDSEGDVYASSAGESVIKVFDPDLALLASIPNANEPCALAVNSDGEVFVSEKDTGNVVRYKPDAFPLSGTPTYGPSEPVDSSGDAEGISIDSRDDRLYVALGTRIGVYNPNGTLGTINEEQTVFIGSGVTGGTYTLTFDGATTDPIPYDADAAQLKAALADLATIGTGNVEVAPAGAILRVTFQGTLAGTDLALLEADGSGLTGEALIGVQEASKGFNGYIAEGELIDATGVAAYTYSGGDRYVYAADAATDQVKVFAGTDIRNLELRREIDGPKGGEDFGFGPDGAYLAVDSGNSGADGKCASVAAQACTAGHLLVYDAANNMVDEFDATGEFLDQFTSAALADAKPTAMALDRSGGPNDGVIYVTAGDAAGARVLAFAPLAAPSRAPLFDLTDRLNENEQLKTARAVSVDSLGNAYVVTGALIHVFDPTGKEIKVGPQGKGIEDPNGPADLAIDSAGNLYVLDRFGGFSNEPKVTYYTPSAYPPVAGTTYVRHEPPIVSSTNLGGDPESIAVNPSNDHLLAAGTEGFNSVAIELDSVANASAFIREFGPALSFPPHSEIGVHGATGNVYLAANPGVILIVNAAGTEVLARINGAGSPKGPFSGINPKIAVDPSNGHVLVFSNVLGAAREYDASGAFVAEFAFPEPQGFTTNLSRPFDIAIDGSGGPSDENVYIAFDDTKPGTPDLWAFAPLSYGETPAAVTGVAGGLGEGSATLNGTVNPRGFELVDCRFEYLTDLEYQQNLEDEDPAFEGAVVEDCAETPAVIGSGSVPVPVHADITGLNPEGRYRFRLVVENKYGSNAGDATLFGPPVIISTTALSIFYDEATVRAKIDPSGLATKYRFEYGTSEAYGQSTSAGELSATAGPSDVQTVLTGLEEGAVYHFRVVAENDAMAVPGPDQTFETQKRLEVPTCPNAEFRTGLSARLPDCRAYELVTPAETNGLSPRSVPSLNASAGFNNWLTTPRGPGAGERLTYFTGGTLPGFNGNGLLDGYRAVRGAGEHPKEGWRSELFGLTYEQAASDVLHTPSQQSVASDQLYSFWQNDPAEIFPETLDGVYLRTPSGFEPVGQGALGTDLAAESRYVSPGGSHVIFFSNAHLEDEAPPQGTVAVYDRPAGSKAAQVISLLPGNVTPSGDATYVAATEDGSGVLFRVGGNLYLRRAGQTTEVAQGPNAFAGISEDGTRVFYAATTNVTGTGNPTPAALYACDTELGPCVGGAEPPGLTEIAPEAIFVNVSRDGSNVFLSSKEALTGSEENEAGQQAEAGERNLYAWDADAETTRFVAQLDSEDFAGFGGGTAISVTLDAWTRATNPGQGIGISAAPTRTTQNGGVFVFQSHARLTSYENLGQGEIYRYDPAAPLGERLLCVSCDPSGSSPSDDAMLAETPFGVHATTIIPNLTDDGKRVFFHSPDRLLPEDANSVVDVYEWQAGEVPGCGRSDGCLALISSGQGEADSFLYGMSADGHDVFFRTPEKLVGQDVPGSPSIYDARIGGGIPDPPSSAPCQADACQGQGSTPPALPSPASTGAGNGNVRRTAKPRCPKGKRKVRRHGKVRCVKRPSKRQGKRAAQRRSHAERGAHR